MSDLDSSQGIRRSQREKKQVQHFNSLGSKRKRTDDSDSDQDDPVPQSDEEEGEYVAKPKPSPVKKKAPPKKKPRTTKPKSTKPSTRKPRKAKETKDASGENETKISKDNPLFNAIMNPSAALQSTAEDFLDSLTHKPGPAQAEFINLILRSCGCNDTVDADQVLDYDGVVDALDNFTEALKQDNSPIYPLTSKLPIFKKFRKSLSELLERLIASAAELGSLYSTDLMPTLQTWVVAMSSSQIRSFRHTATVVALEVETALCDVAAAVEKEAVVIGRQREGERKRKAANKGTNARDKELEAKAGEVRERRTKLAEYLKEFVDGVFVHRYRDLDPNIRAECVRAIGLWFKKYPGHFLDGSYLRYVGWVLSDAHTHVRLEAVTALAGVYGQAEHLAALGHFTERFKPRLLEMATGDTELAVRVAVVGVLAAIDGYSLLEDAEREKLCLLVFDEEARVRRAVSAFVTGVWSDALDARLVGRKVSKRERTWAGAKTLAMLLVKWGRTLDRLEADRDGSGSGADDESVTAGTSRGAKFKAMVSLLSQGQKGRTALAVESLWDEVEPASDWETVLDVLLLDHSAADTEGARGRKKDTSVVDDAWRLDEVEESVLLEVLVAALQRAKIVAANTKKGDEETVTSDITRALIKGLPRLFIKYQTDSSRMANVLLIPPLMNLDLYLEMRMLTAYTSLWDDVTKQFLSHSSSTVLARAVAVFGCLLSATSLANTNSTKVLELEDELSSLLRDAVAGREEIEVASFNEDEVLALTALCARLDTLAGMRDMSTWVEEDEGGKQSSAWDIISALVDRGRLGYKEEESMVAQALHFLTLHIFWKVRTLSIDPEPSAEDTRVQDRLREQRGPLLEKLVEYCIGTQSNTAEGVKRAAFENLMNIHILFRAPQTNDSPSLMAALALTLDDETQYRCTGFVQAEIERYADELEMEAPLTEDESEADNSESGDDGDEEAKRKKRKGKATTKNAERAISRSRRHLEQEYAFIGTMSTFLRAMRTGAIHVRHSATLLSYYGRFGIAYDACCKAIVEILREEGMFNDNGDLVATVATQALRESFSMVLDGVVSSESHSAALAKLLSSSFLIRGAQLAVVRRLDSKFIVQIHTNLLTWIGKRLAMYEKNNNKHARKTSILFFRSLLPLLTTLESRSALTVKAHMDQVFAQAKIEISTTSKIWEPQRAYEKRLGTAMSKDKSTKGRKAKGAKSTALVTSEEETDGESGAEEHVEQPITPPPQRPKPKPISRAPVDVEEPESPLAFEPDENEQPEIVTPKARPRPRAKYKVRSPTKSRSNSVAPPELETNGLPTPKTTRKRPLSDDEDEPGELPSKSDAEESRLSSPPETPPGDIPVRRKRVRH